MWGQASAILWAEWRTLRNYFPRSNRSGVAFSGFLRAAWYGIFAYLAFVAAVLLSRPEEIDSFRRILPAALLLCFLYWQVIPVLMVSLGSSLDMRKLLVYPIPTNQLFALEVLLRISTAIEMVMLLAGAAIGLLLNPKIPWWAQLPLLSFVVFNLCFAAGIRGLLIRLLARRRVREIVVFLLVLAAALPQLLLMHGQDSRWRHLLAGDPAAFWPWTAAARIALGDFSLAAMAVLLIWTAAAYLFGRWQFQRGLRFDFGEAAAPNRSNRRGASPMEFFYRLPNAFFRDPLAALVEKELRFLTRSPRFRLVFLMGFSFGLVIWAPLAFGPGASTHSLLSDNYLTMVAIYALLLLSDALFWNCFGFDRGAVQHYFVAPVKMSTVLVGKNVAASLLVSLEIGAIVFMCAVLRLRISIQQVLEAFAVALVLTLFLLAIGNLSSVYNPRCANPAKSFRTAASGPTQAMLLLAFPLALIPVGLAFLARYAFQTEWAFFAVLLVAGALGGMAYLYSIESAVRAAGQRTEQIISALSHGEGPIES